MIPESEALPQEPTPAPSAPARWSERDPVQAALVYALAYVIVAGTGGLLERVPLPPVVQLFAVTLVILTATLLSLLFVLSVCRVPLRPVAMAALFLATTVIFLVARPEVTLAIAHWWHLPKQMQARLAALPGFPGDTLLGNLALILWATIVGRVVSRIIREGNLLLPVAVVAALADIITVFWGFVGQAAKQAPQVVEALSAQAPALNVAKQVPAPVLTYIGIGDFLFLSLFLTVALRHHMRAAAAMWATFVSMLVAAAVLNIWQPPGLPGLPFIAVGVLWVNRRSFHFSREEKRALAVAGGLIAVVIALGAVLLLRR